jgi:hypothetical protein
MQWTLTFEEKWPFGFRITDGERVVLQQSAVAHSTEQKTRQDNLAGIGFPLKNGQRQDAIFAVAQQDETARLIAAAPEMVTVLLGVLHHNSAVKLNYQLPDSLVGQIQEVLAKLI